MCEHCSNTSVTVERVDPDEESICEWTSEERFEEEHFETCERPAVYAVFEWCVEEHLCDHHAELTKKELEEGLADFLDSVGFGSQYKFRPIEQEETCDYTAPLDQTWQPCGEKARQAKYVLENWLVCAEHAVDMGYDPSESS